MTEDVENGDIHKFINPFIKGLLNLPPKLNLGIERAHRSLQKKPTNQLDPPRSIVAKFSSFRIKERERERPLYNALNVVTFLFFLEKVIVVDK